MRRLRQYTIRDKGTWRVLRFESDRRVAIDKARAMAKSQTHPNGVEVIQNHKGLIVWP